MNHNNSFTFTFKDLKHNFLLKLCLLGFTIVAFTFNETGLMPVFAMMLMLSFVVQKPFKVFNKINKYPIELKLLNLWVVWAYFTGIVVSKNLDFFINGFVSLFLLILVVNLIFIILVYDFILIRSLILAVFISGLIQIFAIQLGFQAEEVLTKEREYGLAGNPNSFGLKLLFASMAILIVMGLEKLKLNFKWILAVIVLVIFLNGIFDSGSRKSAISFFVLIAGFAGICIANRSSRFSLVKIALPLFIVGMLLYSILPIVMEGTVLEQRFIMQEERGGVEGDIRYQMVTFGLDLFADNPFFGVGINNYRAYFFTGQYSHSDYIESLTSTGTLGFLLYQSFFILAIIKSYKLSKVIKNKEHRFYLLFCALAIITIKIIGLGIILYTSPAPMIIMAGIVGYIYKMQQEVNINKLKVTLRQ